MKLKNLLLTSVTLLSSISAFAYCQGAYNVASDAQLVQDSASQLSYSLRQTYGSDYIAPQSDLVEQTAYSLQIVANDNRPACAALRNTFNILSQQVSDLRNLMYHTGDQQSQYDFSNLTTYFSNLSISVSNTYVVNAAPVVVARPAPYYPTPYYPAPGYGRGRVVVVQPRPVVVVQPRARRAAPTVVVAPQRPSNRGGRTVVVAPQGGRSSRGGRTTVVAPQRPSNRGGQSGAQGRGQGAGRGQGGGQGRGQGGRR